MTPPNIENVFFDIIPGFTERRYEAGRVSDAIRIVTGKQRRNETYDDQRNNVEPRMEKKAWI